MVVEATDIHPEFKKLIDIILVNLKDKYGIEAKVCSGLRTIKEQNKLYAQGRTTKGKRVTNARGGDSYHNYGLAVDFCLLTPVKEKGILTNYPDKHPLWQRLREEAEALGLRSGASFKTPDRPHVEIRMELREIKSLYKQGGMELVFARASETLGGIIDVAAGT